MKVIFVCKGTINEVIEQLKKEIAKTCIEQNK